MAPNDLPIRALTPISAFDGKDVDTVLVLQRLLAHGIFEFHAEDARRADAAPRGQGAAEHRESRIYWISLHQVFRGAHRRHGTFLVEPVVRPRPQHERVPVRLYVVVAPGVLGD